MEINKRNFPKILLENEETYFQHLFGSLESADELCHLEVIKLANLYRFRIAPSSPKYLNILIEEIIKLHKLFRIQLEFSKSIRTSSIITFNIKLKKYENKIE